MPLPLQVFVETVVSLLSLGSLYIVHGGSTVGYPARGGPERLAEVLGGGCRDSWLD